VPNSAKPPRRRRRRQSSGQVRPLTLLECRTISRSHQVRLAKAKHARPERPVSQAHKPLQPRQVPRPHQVRDKESAAAPENPDPAGRRSRKTGKRGLAPRKRDRGSPGLLHLCQSDQVRWATEAYSNSEFLKVSDDLGVGFRAMRGKWTEISTGAKHLRFLIHLFRMWPCLHLQEEWTKSILTIKRFGATSKVVPWQLRHLVTVILNHGPCDVFTASWERIPVGIWRAKPPRTTCVVSRSRAEVPRRSDLRGRPSWSGDGRTQFFRNRPSPVTA
jgi:hypothetical protein